MEQKEINSRLVIIKYLYMLGCEALSGGNSIGKSTAILNFHDAGEAFFVLVAEILGAKKTNLGFMSYFEAIAKADDGKGNRTLTHEMQLKKLNKIRVAFKHMAILPNEEECNNSRVSLNDFFCENVPKFCNIDFDQISMANSIQDDEVKEDVKQSEVLLRNGEYKECLTCLGKAFYRIFSKSHAKTKIGPRENAVFLSPEVDLFHAGVSSEDEDDMGRKLNSAYGPLAEVLNIMILGIDYKRYAKFKHLTPSFRVMANGDIREIRRRREFDTRFNINYRNVEFCYFFMINTVLKIEEFDFGLISAWEKPDMVTVIDEDEVTVYTGGEVQKEFDKLKLGKVIKLKGWSHNFSKCKDKQEMYRAIEYDDKQGWIRESVKTKEIDNPELKKFKQIRGL